MFVPHASKIWTKSYGPNYTKFFFFFLNIFDAILEDVSVAETIDAKTTIFHCSKHYGSPTCVTRLKVAPNMADPISIKKLISVGRLKHC